VIEDVKTRRRAKPGQRHAYMMLFTPTSRTSIKRRETAQLLSIPGISNPLWWKSCLIAGDGARVIRSRLVLQCRGAYVRLFPKFKILSSLRPKCGTDAIFRPSPPRWTAFIRFREAGCPYLLPVRSQAEWAFLLTATTPGFTCWGARAWLDPPGRPGRDPEARSRSTARTSSTKCRCDDLARGLRSRASRLREIDHRWYAAAFHSVSFSGYDLNGLQLRQSRRVDPGKDPTGYFPPLRTRRSAALAPRQDRPIDVGVRGAIRAVTSGARRTWKRRGHGRSVQYRASSGDRRACAGLPSRRSGGFCRLAENAGARVRPPRRIRSLGWTITSALVGQDCAQRIDRHAERRRGNMRRCLGRLGKRIAAAFGPGDISRRDGGRPGRW